MFDGTLNMAGSGENSSMNSLKAEIVSLLDTLIALDKNETAPKHCISDHARRISSLMPIESHNRCFPIHQLLSVGPFKNAEIPLDVLETLASHFDVNEQDDSRMTCVNIAIENEHYNAIRYLAKHYDLDKNFHKNPIVCLVRKSNAPLDIIDLLQTDQTLNNNPSSIYLPLHLALICRHYECALYLIQLGANVDKRDDFVLPANGQLPIECYVKLNPIRQFPAELFEKLVPTEVWTF